MFFGAHMIVRHAVPLCPPTLFFVFCDVTNVTLGYWVLGLSACSILGRLASWCAHNVFWRTHDCTMITQRCATVITHCCAMLLQHCAIVVFFVFWHCVPFFTSPGEDILVDHRANSHVMWGKAGAKQLLEDDRRRIHPLDQEVEDYIKGNCLTTLCKCCDNIVMVLW